MGNIATREIMALLGVDETDAWKIQCAMNIDFSGCTKQEFVAEARLAYERVCGKPAPVTKQRRK